jgi:NAD(P)H-quinone oxidoreductase subunit 5
METPTPVSALLHAGLLNAGPFLIVRMAFIMEASTFAPAVLIAIGGFTALFASVVFLTQTSVKTALGYSSVGHMGFSLMACGLGVYPAAMLHLVAHSFYKAHAFLSSGSGIETIRAHKITGAKRMGSPFRIVLGIVLGLGIFTAFAMIWGVNPDKEFALIAIGGIIVLGLSRLFTSAIDSSGSIKLVLRAALMSLIVTLAFFSLESGFHYVLSRQLPDLLQPTFGEKLLIIGILGTFSAVVFVQILAPMISSKPAYRSLVIHIRNGLYVNTLFDRAVNALYTHGSEAKTLVIEPQFTPTATKIEPIKRTEKFAI